MAFPEEFKGTKFEKFTYALTNLSNKYLGTDVKVPQDKEYEEEIFKKLLYRENKSIPENYNSIQTLAFKLKRLYKHAKTVNEYAGTSLSRVFLDAVLAKFIHPETILKKV